MLKKTNRYAACLCAGLLCLLPHAPAQAEDSADLNGYASAMMGNGRVYGTNTRGHPSMRWRSGEIRLGHTLDFSGLGALNANRALRLDVVYINEGHPDNNHRDGYALQMMFRQKLHPEYDLELGAGPYMSMNRTTRNGVEHDDLRVGALISLALLMRLDAYSPGLHMRIGYNHVAIAGAPQSDALMIGIGKDLGAIAESLPPPQREIWLSGAAGFTQTNQSEARKKFSYALEAKTYSGVWAMSVSAINEGRDAVVNRHGIAAQGWYVQPLSDKWTLSAGAGPYLAWDTLQADNPSVTGLATLQLDRKLGDNWRAFTSFGRVITFKGKNDADVFTFGLMRRFDLR